MIYVVKGASAALFVIIAACGPPTPAPSPTPKIVQTGVASRYARDFAGRETASGEPLKLGAMTAASRTLPLGTRVQVVNMETGEAARVTINDRGPYVDGRVLDLTPGAARSVGIGEDEGLGRVAIMTVPSERSAQSPRPDASADGPR